MYLNFDCYRHDLHQYSLMYTTSLLNKCFELLHKLVHVNNGREQSVRVRMTDSTPREAQGLHGQTILHKNYMPITVATTF